MAKIIFFDIDGTTGFSGNKRPGSGRFYAIANMEVEVAQDFAEVQKQEIYQMMVGGRKGLDIFSSG